MRLSPLAPCERCGAELHWSMEKALDGELELVMADPSGAWVCPADGDEHAPPF